LIKRLSILLIALVAAAVFAVGCGDDDEAEGVTTSSVSKAEHVKQTNKICTDGDGKSFEKVQALQSDKQSNEKELAAKTTNILIQDSQTQHDEISELGAPEGSEDQVEAVLVAWQQGLDEAQSKGIESPEDFVGEFKQFDKLAKEYGLDSCVFNF